MYRSTYRCSLLAAGVLLAVSRVLAQDLVIIAPVEGALLQAGAEFVVTASQRKGLSSVHFNEIVAAIGTRGIEVSSLEALEPYMFRARLPRNAIGKYQIYVLARRAGENTVFSLPVTINAQPPSFAEITSASGAVVLGFPGDIGSPLRAFGVTTNGERVAIPDGLLSYAPVDPTIAQVRDMRPIGTGSGISNITLGYGSLTTRVGVSVGVVALRGDFNLDGVVDQRDIDYLTRFLNTQAASSSDARDLNGDGLINALDLRVLTTICTRPRCAVK